jgi:two-component system NtrC family sensor kinase
MNRWNIRDRLISSFSSAILVPALITTIVGVRMIRRQVFTQAQARVDSDLESAKEIFQNQVDRLKDALRIHATRMVIYGALARGDISDLGPEMGRIVEAERLDFLTLTDAKGIVVYRSCRPALAGDSVAGDPIVSRVLGRGASSASIEIVPHSQLAVESDALARQALMEITATPRAKPTAKTVESSGMMLEAAAPVLKPNGRLLGVLYGGVLLNRNYEIVDKVRKTVFKEGVYKGREVGTATIFQDDVRVSTNVKNADGSRAITTRVSAEVAEAVLGRGETWRGRAFVVNDWYLSAYAPIHNGDGKTVGMLYVGTLERPYTDSLWRTLYVFLGIAILGVVLVSAVAVIVSQRISRPIHAMAVAAQRVAQGEYGQKVHVSSPGEVGYLAESFNRMTSELARADQELREWGENLERKVEQRTAELKAIQAHLLQAEKLAAIGKLAAGVAHEINNPLTGVLTNASLMLEDLPAEDPRREELQTIVDETLRCRKIVRGLLDFARQTKPQRQALSLNQVVEDVLALVRNQATFQDIVVNTRLDPGLPEIAADRDQLRQVVLNVVLNAAEAMSGGGRITVSSRALPGRHAVELQVGDTGPGIPEDVRDKLFEPFFTTKTSGTGLGLAIAYGIVQRHGGTIEVESQPGKGTTIALVLPVEGQGSDE